jgi:tetratricopeptide (TPR) repeat protein
VVLRPNQEVDDKNVLPVEMVDYVHNYTDLRALVRVGGDAEILKRLVAAGFPVIVEKGHTTTGWIGHYILLTGYDDPAERFLSQDSLLVAPDSPIHYQELVRWWRHFNFLYLVIYPPDREGEILSILGPHAEPSHNFAAAAGKAREEIAQLKGRDLFFAWYNLGSSLVGLGDFASAAQAYDKAYADIYPTLRKENRPWRTLWYQTGPYEAYFYAARYQEVIRLADIVLNATGKPILEETFYWRGMAREALGDVEGAIDDYRQAVRLNPNATPAMEQIQRLGVEPH